MLLGPKRSFPTFALLDEGSSVTLIDADVAKKIGVSGRPSDLTLRGVGGMGLRSCDSRCVALRIAAPGSNAIHNMNNVRTVPKLELPSQSLRKEALRCYDHLRGVNYASYMCAKPTMLIGQDNWNLIVSREIRSGRKHAPVASRTMLGWIIHGYMSTALKKQAEAPSHACHVCEDLDKIGTKQSAKDSDLFELVKSSFRLDALGVEKRERENALDRRAEQLLDQYTRHKGGYWESCLLWRDDSITLPDSRDNALKRLINLEKKLDSNEDYAKNYYQQMDDLLGSGYAELVTDSSSMEGPTWYLPHFGVSNTNKPGKLRLVFDAAAARVQGVSLNDHLLTGPDLLNSLLGVLMRFRQKRIAIMGDIKQMFLQVKIRAEDQQAQQFLWRGRDRVREPDTYRMTSMIFGARSSPCTALYVLRRNAEAFRREFPGAVEAICRKHYMDDYLDSVDTELEAINLINEVSHIHKVGGFTMRGWNSSSEEVLRSVVPRVEAEVVDLSLDERLVSRTLGLRWDRQADTFSFRVGPQPATVGAGIAPTKRRMLAIIMSIFDPVGFLAPFTVRSKILLQEVWRSGISWDDQLREKEFKKWLEWTEALNALEVVTIPRSYGVIISETKKIELHCFCDASEKAFAAVVYFRFIHTDNRIKTVFVASKNRVAPLKPLSVPRMELQAAVLGCRLAKTIIQEHDFKVVERVFWTDSRTVLCWIRSDPRAFKPFVSHRLGEIDELSDVSEWRWVPTGENPADDATREERLDLRPEGRWFAGPSFLYKEKERWPKETRAPGSEEPDVERKETCGAVVLNDSSILPDVQRFSSWLKLMRTVARVLLFIQKCRKQVAIGGSVTAELIRRAEDVWTRDCQESAFGREIQALRRQRPLPTDSRLKQLTPFLDNNGILRVGSRTPAAPGIGETSKYPIILDGRNPYSNLLIQHYHEKLCHGSPELVINELRQRYWLVHLRPAVRKAIYNCQACKIRKAKASAPRMADLPPARMMHHQRPFSYCGLDYFGPLQVTVGRRREKRWGVLFTCLTTRAIHLEIAASLTTDSAIMALRRMIARRGSPKELYSDNGTNLRGAEVELRTSLRDIDQSKYREYVSSHNITWKFMPPAAPHMGGSWERSVKQALTITLRERAPQEEILATLFAEAEHTINSRPLTHVPVYAEDQEA